MTQVSWEFCWGWNVHNGLSAIFLDDTWHLAIWLPSPRESRISQLSLRLSLKIPEHHFYCICLVKGNCSLRMNSDSCEPVLRLWYLPAGQGYISGIQRRSWRHTELLTKYTGDGQYKRLCGWTGEVFSPSSCGICHPLCWTKTELDLSSIIFWRKGLAHKLPEKNVNLIDKDIVFKHFRVLHLYKSLRALTS